MKVVAFFLGMFALIWAAGTAWCVVVGLHPGGDAQVGLLIMALFLSFALTVAWVVSKAVDHDERL